MATTEFAHGHCRAPGCYNRIQYAPTCSRCGGPVTRTDDMNGACCGPVLDLELSPEQLANERLRKKLCPDCGSANVTFCYLPNNWDPGDVEPTATCNDCGWGY